MQLQQIEIVTFFVTFLKASVTFSPSDPIDQCQKWNASFRPSTPIHSTSKLWAPTGDIFAQHGRLQWAQNQVCGFFPRPMARPQFGREGFGTRIRVVFVGALRHRAVRGLEACDRIRLIWTWCCAYAADLGRQRVGDAVDIQVHRGDRAVFGCAQQDLLHWVPNSPRAGALAQSRKPPTVNFMMPPLRTMVTLGLSMAYGMALHTGRSASAMPCRCRRPRRWE